MLKHLNISDDYCHHTVYRASPREAVHQVQRRADLHEAVVAEQVALGSQGPALEHHQLVAVLHHPEPAQDRCWVTLLRCAETRLT